VIFTSLTDRVSQAITLDVFLVGLTLYFARPETVSRVIDFPQLIKTLVIYQRTVNVLVH